MTSISTEVYLDEFEDDDLVDHIIDLIKRKKLDDNLVYKLSKALKGDWTEEKKTEKIFRPAEDNWKDEIWNDLKKKHSFFYLQSLL